MTTVSHSSAEAERLSQVVADAWSATAPVAHEVGQKTREVAFKLVLEEMLRNGSARAGAEAVPEPPSDWLAETRQDAIDDAFTTETQRADAIADYLGLAHEGVANLYDVSGREPKLHLAPALLSKSSADATREITLLVVAARAALGIGTGTRSIREAVVAHGKLDHANFDPTLTQMIEIAMRGSPGGANRLVRLRGRGVEAARELAQRLAYP